MSVELNTHEKKNVQTLPIYFIVSNVANFVQPKKNTYALIDVHRGEDHIDSIYRERTHDTIHIQSKNRNVFVFLERASECSMFTGITKTRNEIVMD